jgi:Flp pilus assembly protein TadD
LPEAQRELEAAIALDANQASFHYLLGQVYRKLGQLEKAKAEMATFQVLKAKEPPRKSGMQ